MLNLVVFVGDPVQLGRELRTGNEFLPPWYLKRIYLLPHHFFDLQPENVEFLLQEEAGHNLERFSGLKEALCSCDGFAQQIVFPYLGVDCVEALGDGILGLGLHGTIDRIRHCVVLWLWLVGVGGLLWFLIGFFGVVRILLLLGGRSLLLLIRYGFSPLARYGFLLLIWLRFGCGLTGFVGGLGA